MILIYKKVIVFVVGLVVFFGIPILSVTGIQSIEAGNGVDRALALALDGSGGVCVTGYSYHPRSNYDFLTIRYDADGRLLWEARYDGPAGDSDYASAVAVDGNNHVYVAGHSNGRDTSLDLTLVKYDESGNKLWEVHYDGPSHRDDYARAMALDAKGNVFVTGYSFGDGTEHDYVTLKYRPEGELIWADRYNSSINRDDSAVDLIMDGEGRIIVTGTDRVRSTSYDFATIKYDTGGKQLWMARYSGEGESFDTAAALTVDGNGNVYVTGYGDNRETGYDIVTLKYDRNGNRAWTAVYDGTASRLDMAHDIAVDGAGNVWVAGQSMGVDSAFDMCLLKYGADGQALWTARYDGPAGGADAAVCLAVDEESSVFVSGFSRGVETERDIVLLKYDSAGALKWEKRFDGTFGGDDVPTSMVTDLNGNIFVTGYSFGGASGFDFISLKINRSGRILWTARYPLQPNE
jgi:uncharacterized delta-60 repeat protein